MSKKSFGLPELSGLRELTPKICAEIRIVPGGGRQAIVRVVRLRSVFPSDPALSAATPPCSVLPVVVAATDRDITVRPSRFRSQRQLRELQIRIIVQLIDRQNLQESVARARRISRKQEMVAVIPQYPDHGAGVACLSYRLLVRLLRFREFVLLIQRHSEQTQSLGFSRVCRQAPTSVSVPPSASRIFAALPSHPENPHRSWRTILPEAIRTPATLFRLTMPGGLHDIRLLFCS